MGEISIRRVRDFVAGGGAAAGQAFLVDRLWPRGVAKVDLTVPWVRELAPSTELRKWFNHDPARWEEFHRRYLAELGAKDDQAAPILEAIAAGDVVLLYDAKDIEHNQAVVLAEWLRDLSAAA